MSNTCRFIGLRRNEISRMCGPFVATAVAIPLHVADARIKGYFSNNLHLFALAVDREERVGINDKKTAP